MNVRIITHSTELTASTWHPTGATVAFRPTTAEKQAVSMAARMMVGHAVSRIGYSPVGDALQLLRRAVG